MKLLLPRNWHQIRDANRQWWSMRQYQRLFGGESGTGLIGYACFAGLANRVQAHVVALAIGRHSGLPVMPIWPRNSQCGATFDEIFLPRTPTKPPRFERAVVIPASDCPPDQLPIRPGMLNLLDFRWQYEDIFWAQKHGLRDWALDQLQFSPAVTQRLARVLPHGGRTKIGVHVRRGDFVTDTLQARPTAAYVEQIHKIVLELSQTGTVNDPLIYLATDGGQEVRDEFRKGLPDYPVVWSELSSVRRSADSIREAWCDIIELSSCNALVLTGRSSFGRLAQFFSRRPQLVTVVE